MVQLYLHYSLQAISLTFWNDRYICNCNYETPHAKRQRFLLHCVFVFFLILLICNFSCSNKTHPKECLPGSYAVAGSTECQPCPKGTFCPTKGLATHHLCANGTYSDEESLSDCKLCDAGSRCPSVGMEAPEECPNGTYSNSTGAKYCILCPAGHRWGYKLITNLFQVLIYIGHRYLIIQQFIHVGFHSCK